MTEDISVYHKQYIEHRAKIAGLKASLGGEIRERLLTYFYVIYRDHYDMSRAGLASGWPVDVVGTVLPAESFRSADGFPFGFDLTDCITAATKAAVSGETPLSKPDPAWLVLPPGVGG